MRFLCFHLVKVPLLLVEVGGHCVCSLNINHEVLHLSLQPLLGLLQGGTFGVGRLNGLLCLLQTLGQLLPIGQQREVLGAETNVTIHVDVTFSQSPIHHHHQYPIF